jgi:hypothetical protein
MRIEVQFSSVIWRQLTFSTTEMSVVQWWNDGYQGKTEELDKNLLHCHFVHYE